jgi:hypothetical protein
VDTLQFSSDKVGGTCSNHLKVSGVKIIALSFVTSTELCPHGGKQCTLDARSLVLCINHAALLL